MLFARRSRRMVASARRGGPWVRTQKASSPHERAICGVLCVRSPGYRSARQGYAPRTIANAMLPSPANNPRATRMARIAIIDRADMNAEQARVYDAAKDSGAPVGGPFLAYIRLPKLFEGIQTMRAASGPLSRREQQIVNLTVA